MNLGGVIHLNKTGIIVLCGLLFILLLYSFSNRNISSKSTKEVSKINLKELLDIAIKAAENGGKKVVQVKDNIRIKSKGLTKEGLEDSVTTADFLSHCSIIKTLNYFHPSLKIISEEAKTKCDDSQPLEDISYNSVTNNLPDEYVNEGDVTIWIDPLDATHEYTEKLYSFVTTMVCVAFKGKPIIGVVHKPFNRSTSWAWVDKGHSSDLTVLRHEKKDIIKIIVSRSHRGEIEEVLGKNFDKKFQLVIAAGAGYKALEVATKNVDAYLHITAIKKWDICAGNAIINGLGGTVTTKYNKVIDYADDKNVENDNGIIATIENHNMFLGKI